MFPKIQRRDDFSLAVGYLAGEPASSTLGSGLFKGNYGVIGWLLAKDLFGGLDLSFTYIHSYTGITQTPTGTLAGVQTFTGHHHSHEKENAS